MSRRRVKRQRHEFVSPVLSVRNVEQWAYDLRATESHISKVREALERLLLALAAPISGSGSDRSGKPPGRDS
jgi:hypothetical protein